MKFHHVLVGIASLVFGIRPTLAQTVVHVDDDAMPGGNGVSWNGAFVHLQDGLTEARAVIDGGGSAVIRIAQGTYTPDLDEAGTVTPGDRSARFDLTDDLVLLGGYAGIGEPNPDLRDPSAFFTFLNGDLDGDDGPDFANREDNSFTIARAFVGGGILLDGLRVDGANSSGNGGGLTCQSSTLSIVDCTFTSCFADQGGAFSATSSSVSATNCRFEGNRVDGNGGGVHVSGDAGSVFTDCVFVGNDVTGRQQSNGGAMVIINADPVLLRCHFDGNTSVFGGAIGNDDGSAPMILDCTFIDNEADHGGAMYSFSSSPHIECCVFLGNVSMNDGGGMINDFSSSPEIIGCVFSGNAASARGGAIRNFLNSSPLIESCTFVNNTSADGGGAMFSLNTCFPDVSNTILWNNVPDEIQDQASSSTAVDYCIITGGWTGDGSSNLDADPLLLDPLGPDMTAGTLDDDVHLTDGSPAVAAGDATAPDLPAEDCDGEQRIQNCAVDIGYDESPFFLDCNSTGMPDACEVQDGTSFDFDQDGIPDECQFPGLFTGTSGGSWFDPGSWADGMIPDSSTDVIVPVEIQIDGDGATAQSVTFLGAGGLTFEDGSLTVSSLVVPEGHTVRGSGTIFGSVVNQGIVDPGAPIGVLTIDGAFTQFASGQLLIDVNGDAVAGIDYDLLSVTGEAGLGGQLRPQIMEPFIPLLFHRYDFLTSANTVSIFGVVFTTNLPGGRLLTVEYPGTAIGPAETTSLVVVDLDDIIEFDSPDEFAVNALPSDAVVGDFGGSAPDFVDLAVTVPALDSVFVLYNSGTNGVWDGFQAAVQIENIVDPTALIAAFIDGDALLDLAVVSTTTNTVCTLLNDGNDTFDPCIDVGVGPSPIDIVAGQFDQDAITDLATANAGDGTLTILTGFGNGVFTVERPVDLGGVPIALEVGQFAGNPSLDLVAVIPGDDPMIEGLIQFIINDGLGGFDLGQSTLVGRRPRRVCPEDVDLDKDLDVIVVNEASADVSIVLNNDNVDFAASLDLPVGGTPSSLAAFRMDEDEDSDLAIAVDDPVDGRLVRIFRNDLFGDPPILAFVRDDDEAVGLDPLLVRHGDVNNDLQDDLITINDELALAEQSTGPLPTTVAVFLNTSFVSPPCLSDLNGDGVDNVQDLLILLATWGPCDPQGECFGDINVDDVVNVVDLLILLGGWGLCE